MNSTSNRKHVFISHHHADDDHVEKMTKLLVDKGADIRNSSIRAKPANQERLKKGMIPERTLKRLLRMKISWAKTVVVLVGANTHSRPWVNWEIDQANAQGKRIVGVFTHGSKDAELPESLRKYGSAIVGWNAKGILDAIDGGQNQFQNPDGSPRDAMYDSSNTIC